MRSEVRASLFGAMATIAFTAATIGAGTASAAPGEVTMSRPAASASTLTSTITNNSDRPILCYGYGADAGSTNPASYAEIRFGFFTDRNDIPAGKSRTVTYSLPLPGELHGGSEVIPDGAYDVYWVCQANAAPDEIWGTAPPMIDPTPPTAPPHLNVIVKASEPEPEPSCFGSVCLP